MYYILIVYSGDSKASSNIDIVFLWGIKGGRKLRLEFNGLSKAQSAAAQGIREKKETPGLKLTPNFDTVKVSKNLFVDKNGIPKNVFLGDKVSYGKGTELERRIDSAYLDYYTGQGDEQSVKNTLLEVVETLRSDYVEMGYDEKEIMPHIIEDVYATARLGAVSEVKHASFLESKELVAQINGHDGNTKDFIYYNSDYYFKCENIKTSLMDQAKELGEKYGVTELDLSRDYKANDPRRCYNSYNTIINNYAGKQWRIGNMLDDDMVPPENFRFLYKSGDTGTNIFPESIAEKGDSSQFGGLLQVWQGDWSYTGRVPVRMDATRNPAINMYDVVSKGSSNVPKESINFFKNFDFFSSIQCGAYFRSQYLY